MCEREIEGKARPTLTGCADLSASTACRQAGIGEVEQEQENIRRVKPREARHEKEAQATGTVQRRIVIVMDDEAAEHEEQGHSETRQRLHDLRQRSAAFHRHVVRAGDQEHRQAAQAIERRDVGIMRCGPAVAEIVRVAHDDKVP